MIQDPAILANILIVLFIALAMVLVYLAGRARGRRDLARRRELRRRLDELETHGDEGGHPAPEIGSGLLAGDDPK